mmetsp:Transcript_15443/g.21509  ORF Transcript_15443/g.21509 Transcript_15443/m.21509 type:complete len:222 (+) Transcript_15443:84-749(+)
MRSVSFLAVVTALSSVDGFTVSPSISTVLVSNDASSTGTGTTTLFVAAHHQGSSTGNAGKSNKSKTQKGSDSFLLEDFTTASGEVVNPYKILKVSRTADRTEIKKAYRELSRRYHPDGARFREVLPGSCNDADDVREHWERIKLSYEILSDRKMRMKYDRHSTIADPGAAVGRAALNALGWGIAGVSKGLFKVGAGALDQMAQAGTDTSNNQATEQPGPSP